MRAMPKPVQAIASLIGLAILAGGVFLYYCAFAHFRAAVYSTTWPSTKAIVLESEVKERSAADYEPHEFPFAIRSTGWNTHRMPSHFAATRCCLQGRRRLKKLSSAIPKVKNSMPTMTQPTPQSQC